MTFDLAPMLPLWLLAAVAAVVILGALYGLVRGARGMVWRALAVLMLLGWMAGPRSLHPVLRPVPQDALLIVDHSPSMQVGQRASLADQTANQITQDATHLPGLTLHRIDVPGGAGHGTRLFDAMDHADLPQGRFAGAIVVTDGMDHDVPSRLPTRFQGSNGQKLPHLLHSGFPGRVNSQPVYVARNGDEANDDVSPVIIGNGDWAHAWAVDASGNHPYAVLPGGDDQRTQAYRFGVNMVLYALTGNYKSDQAHYPEMLHRLGQDNPDTQSPSVGTDEDEEDAP